MSQGTTDIYRRTASQLSRRCKVSLQTALVVFSFVLPPVIVATLPWHVATLTMTPDLRGQLEHGSAGATEGAAIETAASRERAVEIAVRSDYRAIYAQAVGFV